MMLTGAIAGVGNHLSPRRGSQEKKFIFWVFAIVEQGKTCTGIEKLNAEGSPSSGC